MMLKNGCPGCERRWGAPDAEGRCSRCKRCLECCARESVRFTCSYRAARRTTAQQAASDRAYKRWEENPGILGHNRRIT